MSVNKQLNIIFMGHLSYPEGHASTKRVQNTIDALRQTGYVTASLLILRQGRVCPGQLPLSGIHKGIPYATIGQDITPGISVLWKAVRYYRDGIRYLKASFSSQESNILYVYGYPSLDNMRFVRYGRKLGYRIVFDIVEDIFYQSSASDFFARLKHRSAQRYVRRLETFADGILAISTHLVQRLKEISHGRVEVMHYPINIAIPADDMPEPLTQSSVRIFYGGTFTQKDDVENLIKAFDGVAKRHDCLELILTGRGSPERMERIKRQAEESKHADKIQLKGYLQEQEYQKVLKKCDILCMVRTDSAFANTGFPFKLGGYLATGKPVIASNVGDVSFYLKDKESAVLVKPGSVDSIIEALEYLVSHPQQAKEMGQRGKAVAQTHFEMYGLAKKILPFLENISQAKKK